ncbi:spectrin binding, partial [Trichomonas vaginalis G3]
MAEHEYDHYLYNELTERYRLYQETFSSFMRIKTTEIEEIQKIYQTIKTNLLDTKIFSPKRI